MNLPAKKMLSRKLHTKRGINRSLIIPKSLPGGVYPHIVRNRASGKQYQYYRRQWREGGKLKHEYVRLRDVDDVRAACSAWQQARRESQDARQQWRDMLAQIRVMEQNE